jgi:hypothetical protein
MTTTDPAAANPCLRDPHDLSVVIRTMGTRNDRLEEALLCLAGQEETPHEVIVVMHRVPVDRQPDVGRLAGWAREVLHLNVRLMSVDEGFRGAPLAAGFAEATGCLVAFLDDDDHVVGDWSRKLLDVHRADPTIVPRIVVAHRDMAQAPLGGVYSTSRLTTPYPATFSWLGHFSRNGTPIHGFAVPTATVRRYGIEMDGSLEIVEDWDFLMAVTLRCGVMDVAGIAAIYHIDERAMRSNIPEEVWRSCEALVRSRLWAELERLLLVEAIVPRGMTQDVARLVLASESHGIPAPRNQSTWRQDTYLRLLTLYARNLGPVQTVVRPGSRLHSRLRRSIHRFGGYPVPMD